ncbi:MAG: type II secretion system protein [Bacilli bacterium]
MKEKNKGFTLVELLAVIVILALIALIATPIILNVINDAKKQAAKDSAYGYMDAVEKYIVSSELEDKSIQDGRYSVEELNKKISVKGSTPDNGNIEIKNSSVKSYDIGIDGYVVSNGKVDKVGTTKKDRKWNSSIL